MKRLLSLLLTLWAALCSYAYDFTYEGIYYEFVRDDWGRPTNYVIVVRAGYNQEPYNGNVVIPSNFAFEGTSYTVTSIDFGAFSECSNLTGVAIPNSVTSIGSYAFKGCSSLTNITIPNGVKSIGSYAFENCYNLTSITIPEGVESIEGGTFSGCISLTHVTIPQSVKNIGDNAFNSCNSLTNVIIPKGVTSIGKKAFAYADLTSITIPEGVVSIGEEAFLYCSFLSNINIPSSVTNIGEGAFCGCYRITSMTVSEGNAMYDSRDNCDAIIESSTNTLISGCSATTIPNGVTSIGNNAFKYCSNLTTLNIPNSVTSIGDYAFSRTGLTSIAIPAGVTYLGDYAFQDCESLSSATLPESITSLGSYVFSRCRNLNNVVVPNNVVSIGYNAFSSCSNLSDITIPNSVTSIGTQAFAYTSITSINIPEGVTEIGNSSFYGCTKLPSVTIPSSVTNIGYDAFASCTMLASVTILNDAVIIETDAFENTPWYNAQVNNSTGNIIYLNDIAYKAKNTTITSCTLKSTTKSIAPCAFDGCTGLTSVSIPDGVLNIGRSAFRGCTGLTSITIPESVTSVGSYAFYGCANLTRATIHGELETIAEEAFRKCTNLVSVTLPNSLTSIDTSAFYQCTNLTNITIPEGVLSIGERAFSSTNLTNITIPESVTNIGGSAFSSTKLTNITIPIGVTYIGDWAFSGCSELSTVRILGHVNSMGTATFSNCTSISSVAISDNVTNIGERAFEKCTSLTSISIPNSVTTIGNDSFSGCTNLSNVFISNGVANIGNGAFSGCTNLASITIPESVTSIGSFAFWNCNRLADVTFSVGITDIGSNAFGNCRNLTNITIPGSVKAIEYGAFQYCGLTDVTICEGVKIIEESAFGSCTNLINITIPESVTSISGFSYCSSLTNITIPESVTSIERMAFSGCSGLTNITIPKGVTRIGGQAFSGCSGLMNITIPEGVTIIEPQAFEMCTSLTTVIIPCNVEYIGFATFGGCQQLSNLTCLAENVPITDEDEDGNSYLFAGTKSAEGTLYVPFESMDAYRAAKEWCTWSNIVGIEHDTDISDIANTIYFENCEAFCGKTIELPIKMKNDIVATGFQFDIVLPEGITAVQDEDGFYDITLSTERTTAAKTNTFDSSLMSDGSIRVLAASTRNYAFSGNDGEVCVVRLNVSEDLPAGDYPIILKNIELTNAQGQTWNVERLKRTISVKDYQLGDANGDGRVSVGDFSAVANHILGTTPEGFNLGAADANQDNNISVGDLSTIATMILSNENSGASKVRAKAAEELVDLNNYIYADPVVISEDGDATIVFNMKNEIAATGFQFNFKLPEGFEVTEDEDGFLDVFLSQIRTTSRKTNTFDCVKWDDGSYRVLAASTKNYEFSGNDGEVVTVHIQKKADVESGDYELLLTDIELTNASGETFRNSKAVYTITVPSNTNEIALVDGETYDNPTTTTCDALTFSKTFSASAVGKWNAFYVPMSVNVEEYAGELDFAEIYAFCAMRDTNGDGVVDANDENFLYVYPLTTGIIKPNVPYLIRPREAKTYVINSADNVLYAAAQGMVEFSTARDRFTVTGLYEPFTVVAGDNNYYVSSTGTLDYRTTGSTTVKANRWIMHRESKEYGGGSGDAAASNTFNIAAIGEDIDEATAIKLINAANEQGTTNVEVYSLDGRKLNATCNLRTGVYIKNGQKIIVK